MLRLSAVGDIMLGDLPACSGFGVGSMIAKHGPLFPFAHCRESFSQSDIVFGNLEVVMSGFDPKRDPFHRTHLRAQPAVLAGLQSCGFNVLSLANNHIMQHGRSAVLETLAILQREQINFTGLEDPQAGIQNFTVREARGMKLGFLAYNFRPPQYSVDPPIDVPGSEERILAGIEGHRSLVDVLVLSLHWGEEFVVRPSSEQVRLARRFVDAGAQLILGHHPHILQGIERFRKGVIAYSLGDFVFDLWQERLRESVILHVQIAGPADVSYEMQPVLINRSWQPVPLVGSFAAATQRRMARLAELIDPEFTSAEYDQLVASELARFRREVYVHYALSLHRFGARRLWENLKGVLGRRLRRKTQSC